MVGGEAQQGFERNMAVEASIVAKHEFVEIPGFGVKKTEVPRWP
jgi:hypothetical protein